VIDLYRGLLQQRVVEFDCITDELMAQQHNGCS
jgi:hypothetical protein